jgi:hypothetical protein
MTTSVVKKREVGAGLLVSCGGEYGSGKADDPHGAQCWLKEGEDKTRLRGGAGRKRG